MAQLNKSLKRRWVAALRVAGLKQTQACLHKVDHEGNESFCCLGVLSNMLVEELNLDMVKIRGGFIYNKSSAMPPAEVDLLIMPKADRSGEVKGWNHKDLQVLINGRWGGLHEHNDAGRTFGQIATAIEDQL